MDITILFEQVFGIYLILTGALIIIQQEHIVSVARMFGKDQALRFTMGALVTLGGLFMVLTYRDWSSIETIIITLVGWLVLLKGLVLFFASDKQITQMMNKFIGAHAYKAWGVVAFFAGVYLVLIGFGIIA